MRRSAEVLDVRLGLLDHIRNVHEAHVRSALGSDAPPDVKAKVRANSASWMEHWAAVHTKAWGLWLEAGGAKS